MFLRLGDRRLLWSLSQGFGDVDERPFHRVEFEGAIWIDVVVDQRRERPHVFRQHPFQPAWFLQNRPKHKDMT
jgi:hypothetical protein